MVISEFPIICNLRSEIISALSLRFVILDGSLFLPAGYGRIALFEDENLPQPLGMLLRQSGRHHFFNHRCNVIGDIPDVNRILS